MWIMLAAGGGVLLLVLLMKKSSSSSTSTEAPTPTYTSVPAALPGNAEVGQAELARYESAMTEQLPAVIRSSVEDAMRASAPNTEGNQTAQIISSLASFAGALGQRTTGEQVGGGLPSPSSPAPVINVTLPAQVTSAPSAGATASLPAALGAGHNLPLSSYPNVNPKSGKHYRDVLFEGAEAHEYFGTLPGGLGPHHDIIKM